MKEIKLIELFAGSRSIGKVAESKGIEVFSVDWKAFKDIDLVADISKLKPSDFPFVPNAVWASPDCKTYSIAACSTHRKQVPGTRHKEPVSDYAKQCDETNKHFIYNLIDYWLSINPELIFFIENPRGNLRHMDFMQGIKRHTVWYCQYGDDRAKPTDIFTNSNTWIPKPLCRNYKYDKDGNIINRHCHHESARRGARTGTQGKKGNYERSIIPEQLCQSIIESLLI